MDTFIENFLGIIQFSEHEIQNEKILGKYNLVNMKFMR
jgi:hypothetical protein